MKKVIIIAEAGVNHNGDLNLAKRLIDAAVDAGVDYVKFQTFKAENIVNKSAEKAGYQVQNSNDDDNFQFKMLKELELAPEIHEELISYCKSKSIKFLSTPFDLDSIVLLKSLGITIGKIPSGEVTNLPYLKAMARTFREIILSTGMSEMDEIAAAIEVLHKSGMKMENLTVLHCNTEYPTPMSDVNLLAMRSIRDKFNVKIGYSDHTLGIEVPIAAVALGATVIEKHFTLDRTMKGPDHRASLEPDELKKMVNSIRNIELALGHSTKSPSNSESKNINNVRKSIVAKTDIQQGQLFTENNLTVKRPGNGINPMQWDEVLGKTAWRNFKSDELIDFND